MVMNSLDIFRNSRNLRYSYVHKFGSNFNLDATSQSIWSAGGLYPWSALSSAVPLYVSTDAADTGSVTIEGLDENYAELKETVPVATPTTTINSFLRVFRMRYSDTTENVGTITAKTTDVNGTVVAQIDPGAGQTLMAIYTVPSGKIGYFLQYTVGTGKGDDAEVKLFTRGPNDSFAIKSETKSFQTTISQEFGLPFILPEKSDIDFRGETTTPNSDCIVNFDVVICDT
jgi:hypothetical protein